MKKLHVSKIVQAVRDLCIQANVDLPQDVEAALHLAQEQEISPFGRYCLEQITKNITLARHECQAMCQDTGIVVVYLEIGQDLHITGGDLKEAVNEGVRRGYEEGYLRKSVVEEPVFERNNTKDNTPAVIHIDIVAGDRLKLMVMPKGGGSENMGALAMLKPTVGKKGVVDFVVNAVSQAGGNPCPPIVIGVGIGGTMERSAELAKEALKRKLGTRHPDERYARMEAEILTKVNELGIGPQGLGGKITALECHIETAATHIATLPVAVNLNCHAARHHELILEGDEL